MTNILHITLKKHKTCRYDFLLCKYDIYQSEVTSQRLLNNPKKKKSVKKIFKETINIAIYHWAGLRSYSKLTGAYLCLCYLNKILSEQFELSPSLSTLAIS